MYHLVYRTTCNVTGKYYIGVHTTKNVDDGYLGSGLRLKLSVSKYGYTEHTREVLHTVSTREEAFSLEVAYIALAQSDPLNINIKPGGEGGWTREDQVSNSAKGNRAMKILRATDPEWVARKSAAGTDANNRLWRAGRRTPAGAFSPEGQVEMSRRAAATSGERIAKRKERGYGYNVGESNSQHGSRWMIKNGVPVKVPGDQVNTYLEQGFAFGRK